MFPLMVQEYFLSFYYSSGHCAVSMLAFHLSLLQVGECLSDSHASS